jgi:hypothetical protein
MKNNDSIILFIGSLQTFGKQLKSLDASKVFKLLTAIPKGPNQGKSSKFSKE